VTLCPYEQSPWRPAAFRGGWSRGRDGGNASKYNDEEVRTIKLRIRRAAKARQVALPDPDEFVELMARVRKRKK
jgi:uncharacterized protein DUF6582